MNAEELLPDAVLVLALALTVAKALALTMGNVNLIGRGSKLVQLVRDESASPEAIEEEMLKLSPFDRRVAAISSRRLRVALKIVFLGPVAVAISAFLVVALAALTDATGWLLLSVGISGAICTVLHLLVAVVRRLAFGRHDWRTPDVALPRPALLRHWSLYSDQGSNVAVYFLILVFLAVVGFVGLYAGLDKVDPRSFSASLHVFPLTWLYLSATTISTVGFGDIHARSAAAQIAVTTQVAIGPLLLSFLVAVLLTPASRSPGGRDGLSSPTEEASAIANQEQYEPR